jgi:hypothetical protein
MQPSTIETDNRRELADKFIQFLETGIAPAGLFAPDLFLDFTLPLWRLQATNAEDAIASRRAGHPSTGRVPTSRFDRTERGFVLEVEETWEQDGDSWYCRELFRADVRDDVIAELAVYCTGDWDSARVAEHRAAVVLARP